MIDREIINKLNELDNLIQPFIDELAKKRQAAPSNERYVYSYVSKKIDLAGKAIGMAIDKMNYKNIEFKLDTTN